jgi:hypothetical protein
VPRILRMPKPPPRAHKVETPPTLETTSPLKPEPELGQVQKTPPMAEIILFPNAKETISGMSELQPDPQTKTRWLKLADEVLEEREVRKKG